MGALKRARLPGSAAITTLLIAFSAVCASAADPQPAPVNTLGVGALLGIAWRRLGGVLLVLVLSFVAYRVIMGALGRAIRTAESRAAAASDHERPRHQRTVTVLVLLGSVARWAVALLALIWTLAALGVNLVPILTGVGFLGAAVAFGAQSLVKDVVTGFFVLLEGQYAVGDFVELNGKFGRVEAVGLRTTVLHDTRGQLHHIPNGTISTCTVYRTPAVSYLLRVPLARAEDLPIAAKVVGDVAADMTNETPPLLGLASAPVTAHNAATMPEVRLAFSVFPTQDWVATAELPSRVKAALARLDIPLPEGMAPHSDPALSPALLANGLPGPEAPAREASPQ